jgi:hypothetical protein
MTATGPLDRYRGTCGTIALVTALCACNHSAHIAVHTNKNTAHDALAPVSGIVLNLKPVTVDRRNVNRTRFGKLTLVSAHELTSSDKRFGGISALLLDGCSSSGCKLLLVSDRGWWFETRMRFDERGVLKGLAPARRGMLRRPDGAFLQGRQRDAESIARHPKTGYLIGFEQRHRVWHYPTIDGVPSIYLPTPPQMKGAPRNGGFEAMDVLENGHLLVISEGHRADAQANWAFMRHRQTGVLTALRYRTHDGYRPTDMVRLVSGDVLVLERYFSWLIGVTTRIRLIDAQALLAPKANQLLLSTEVARFETDVLVDNFEGMDAVRDPTTNETTLFIIADNNYKSIQRTLLYQFRFGAL